MRHARFSMSGQMEIRAPQIEPCPRLSPAHRCVARLEPCSDRPTPYWAYLRRQNQEQAVRANPDPDAHERAQVRAGHADAPKLGEVTPVREANAPIDLRTVYQVQRRTLDSRLVDVLA